MNLSVAAVTEWWDRRESRERRLLQILGIILAALFVWYAILIPLRMIAQGAEARYARAAQQLQEVESAADAIARNAQQPGDRNSTLTEIVSSTAAGMPLVLDALRADTENEITIEAHAADPALLFGWIEQLQENHAVMVTNFSATRNGEGWLDAESVLARNAP